MDSVTAQLQKILNDYSEDVRRAANESIDVVSKAAVNKLKNTSPKRAKNGGRYAKGWTAKKERGSGGIYTVTVHNKTDYQLTHLLENGHVVRNKYGTYDRAPGIKHIKPVEEWAQNELPNEIRKELE